MGKILYRKPEPVDVQGLCIKCGVNKQEGKGGGKYRPICSTCRKKRHGMPSRFDRVHTKFKKDSCEKCGFVPEHPCQLDVDHINGDHKDNRPDNLQTLCANCHRLKTWKNRDWDR